MTVHSRRFVLHALLLVAVMGVLLSTAWVTFWAAFTLDPEGPGPVQLHQEALSAGIGCGLLVGAAGAFRLLGVDRWLVVVDAVLAAVLGLVACLWAMSTAHGQDYVDGNPWGWVLWMWAITPTTWPVVVVLIGTAVVRGRSRLARR